MITAFSTDRFESYRAARGYDDARALALYVWNAEVCASFYLPLQTVEIGLRNTCHREMQRVYGNDWPLDPAFKGSDLSTHKQINEITGRLRAAAEKKNPPPPGKPFIFVPTTPQIVAGLGFGFWSFLLGKKYDRTYWRTAIHNSFPGYTTLHRHKISRGKAAETFGEIRNFRNRAFHHEPLFGRNSLRDDYDRLLEATRWISEDLYLWLKSESVNCDALITKGPLV